jgi:hypothetical protein
MIPLNISTESDGIICLSNLSIEYEFEAWICGTKIKNSIQEYIDSQANPDWVDGNGTWYVAVPILIKNSGLGCINIRIEVFYDMPPSFVEILSVRMLEDSYAQNAVNLSNYFYDDHDTGFLNFSILNEENPSVVQTILTGSMLSFYAIKQNWFGSVNITVAAYDRYNMRAFTNITIIVEPVNDAPNITAFDDVFMYSNETYVLDLYSHAIDPEGDAVTWSFTLIAETQISELVNVSLVYDTLYIEPFTCSNGNFSIILSASDVYGDTANTTFKVTIINACIENLPPVISTISDIYMLSNETFTIDLSTYGIDPDGDNLTWEVIENSDLFDIARLGDIVTILPYHCANGSARLFLRLIDEHGYFSLANITVNIMPSCQGNSAPVILPGLEQINLTKELFTVDLSSLDMILTEICLLGMLSV